MVTNGQKTVFWKTLDDDGWNENRSFSTSSRQNQITGDFIQFFELKLNFFQFQNKADAQYSGTLDAIKKIARREGLNGDYSNFDDF